MAYTSRIRQPVSGFNRYAAGAKVYNGGSHAPNLGPVDRLGYQERDLKHRMRRQAILNRMKAAKNKKFASADYQREV